MKMNQHLLSFRENEIKFNSIRLTQTPLRDPVFREHVLKSGNVKRTFLYLQFSVCHVPLLLFPENDRRFFLRDLSILQVVGTIVKKEIGKSTKYFV